MNVPVTRVAVPLAALFRTTRTTRLHQQHLHHEKPRKAQS